MKLNIGCGNNKLDGYINIDSVGKFNPDLIHDITQTLPYDDLSIDEILAASILEHFDKYMRFIVFFDWVRVLKIGGVVKVKVPDFKIILSKYKKFGFDNFVDSIFGENMLGSKIYCGHYGNHKFAYCPDSLKTFVTCFGIEPQKIIHDGYDMTLVGQKVRHVSQGELDNVLIHSHANSFGDVPDLPLHFIREKISDFQKNN
jgi:hypothetical protein